jgi:hypothetical protein
MRHHSLSVALAYQTSLKGFNHEDALSNLAFHSGRLVPRGFYPSQIENRNYVATSINYALPVWYPDLGCSLIQFKRVRLNLGFDYASFDSKKPIPLGKTGLITTNTHRQNIYSYGGDITIDFTLFRMPAAATASLTLSVYQPHGGDRPFVSVGVGMPF